MNVSSIDGHDKKWYKYLSEKRIKKVERLKRDIKKAQSIGAELLLNYAIKQELDTLTPVQWDTDKNGKLYLTEHDNIYVNLSHSKDYAVCAIHDKNVGVDIQHKTEYDMKLAERYFCDEEIKYVNNHTDRQTGFFEIWTKKESFLKAVGKGIRVPLKSFSVLGDEIEYNSQIYRFKKYKIKDNNYDLSVCFLV